MIGNWYWICFGGVRCCIVSALSLYHQLAILFALRWSRVVAREIKWVVQIHTFLDLSFNILSLQLMHKLTLAFALDNNPFQGFQVKMMPPMMLHWSGNGFIPTSWNKTTIAYLWYIHCCIIVNICQYEIFPCHWSVYCCWLVTMLMVLWSLFQWKFHTCVQCYVQGYRRSFQSCG